MKRLQVLAIGRVTDLSPQYLYQHSPHRYLLTETAEQAIERIQTVDFDLVVVDDTMAHEDVLRLQALLHRQLPEARLVKLVPIAHETLTT